MQSIGGLECMRRAVVVGASGFIGSHLCDRLLQLGWQVAGTRRAGSDCQWLDTLPMPKPVFDVRRDDPERLVADADVIFHAAGLLAGSRQALEEVNGIGVRRLLEACSRRAVPPTVVLISSLAAAGPSMAQRPRQPGDVIHPVSNYGASKRSGELQAAWFADRVPLTIVRPAVVFGPRDRELLQLVRAIDRTRVNVIAGFHRPPISMVSVSDLVEGIIKAALVGARVPATDRLASSGHGAYFFADPTPMTFADLGKKIGQLLGFRWTPNLPIPVPVTGVAAWLSESLAHVRGGRMPTFNRDKIREAKQAAWSCDVSRSIEELQWEPAASLEMRLAQMVAWYQSEGWVRGRRPVVVPAPASTSNVVQQSALR
jgi:nucleoside-diphosphate-sugar epimerase